MKDGIYAVEVDEGGRMVVVKGEVRHGIFRGLGSIAHLTGLFMAGEPEDVQTSSPVRVIADPGRGRVLVERTPSPVDFDQAFQQARHRSLIDESIDVRQRFRDQVAGRRATDRSLPWTARRCVVRPPSVRWSYGLPGRLRSQLQGPGSADGRRPPSPAALQAARSRLLDRATTATGETPWPPPKT